jgi:hypothetical protein
VNDPSGPPSVAVQPAQPASPVALYLHIPFCVSLCPYCDFVVYAGSAARGPKARVAAFVDALHVELDLRAEIWRKRGAALKRLILDRWPSWATRLQLWREALAEQGVQGRDADNWATTMAMAQMMRAEALPQPDELMGWAIKVGRVIKAGAGDAANDADEILVHFLSQRLDVFRRGQTYTLAQWLMVAASLPGAPEGLLDGYAHDAGGREARAKAANAHLAPFLIRVVTERGAEPRLFVGNKKVQPLLDLFTGTQWAGGAWSQSLARIKGAVASPVARTLAGVSARGWEIPLSAIAGLEVFPQDRIEVPPVASASVNMEDWQ